MVKLNQSSFRRILLSRILLLSVPVLLIGEAVAFRKVRSSLLERAHQYINISAVEKSEQIQAKIATMQTKMLLASQTTALKSGSPIEVQQFLRKLLLQLPNNIKCLQLTNLSEDKLIASTCDRLYPVIKPGVWSQQGNAMLEPQNIQIRSVFTGSSAAKKQTLLFSAPVYSNSPQRRYALQMQLILNSNQGNTRPPNAGTITDSTVIIAENGTIIVHPLAERVGSNISQQPDSQLWKKMVSKAIARPENDLNNFSFIQNGETFLASYKAIDSPITTEQGKHWVILAVTAQNTALQGLEEIKLILVLLTISLLGVSLLTALHLARKLAEPLEQLRDYALKLQNHHEVKRMPHNFKIREFNQLATALNRMVERLKMSAEELEIAWEEAKAANESKSNFLATTSHELRNPLNAIINCIRLVREDCCDDKQEETEFLERAEEAAIHLLGIINDLLDIAKIESGKLSLVMEELDLQQVLHEVISLQAIDIHKKNLQLITAKRPEPIIVKSDRAKLKQVLINVIGNAAKFTEAGSITIQTQIELEASSNSWRVSIMVEDTGIGIEPSQQHKLFRPFGMADGTTTRKFGGTGLGLAISRNLVELMGGSIMLCSAGINQGTTVVIFLPASNVLELPQFPEIKTRAIATPPAGSIP
ncbi:hybrid sensor histidine kinase/response regulator [Synechocystis sp. PCC 7509]|uniref:hybrid sensor histidine kinase/response regulator n=1 Tax=Synechocystis sp. PCC 7509 TaxID=927677 RepID=UPI0002ABF2F6|nr:hybrid sensor histidine kinase/response regulator [Synechocystis sp. PCC 7509]